jgi:hypothetical protein
MLGQEKDGINTNMEIQHEENDKMDLDDPKIIDKEDYQIPKRKFTLSDSDQSEHEIEQDIKKTEPTPFEQKKITPKQKSEEDWSLQEQLKVYYQRLFPYKEFFHWLSYGNGSFYY